jgi:GNAT superfamily N-acetyltransferase
MSAIEAIRLASQPDVRGITAMDHLAAASPARREFIERSVDAGRCFVAVRGRHALGYAVLEDTFFGYNLVSMLYVAEGVRRSGIGAALLGHMERACRTPKLFVTTNESNAPMRSLLTRLGFEASGVIGNLDDGDPELVFYKRLRGGGVKGLGKGAAQSRDAGAGLPGYPAGARTPSTSTPSDSSGG